jgi:hypothetical protein
MTKLTHYTSFKDMKSSKNSTPSNKNLTQKESELKEFIALLKTNSPLKHSGEKDNLNKLKSGK